MSDPVFINDPNQTAPNVFDRRNINIPALGTGTASASTFLAGDGAWKAIFTTITDLPTLPACRAFSSSNQTITTGTTTAVLLSAESYDNDTMHSVLSNTERFTVFHAGVYAITGNVFWSTVSATGVQRQAWIRVNGSTLIVSANATPSTTVRPTNVLATQYKFSVNDYFEIVVRHDVGSDLDILGDGIVPQMTATWVSAG